MEKRLRLDELGRKGYRILQDPDAFCFGIDAVLLADFAAVRKTDRVLDLGTGNGILPLLLDARDKGREIVGLELQEPAAELARRNFALNGAEGRLQAVSGDIREASSLFGKASFDAVITNPPYQETGRGVINPASAKSVARHEIACKLEDVLREAAAVLKLHGRFFMVHRPKRLTEILGGMENAGIAPRIVRFVHSHAGDPASLLLVSGVRGGGKELRVLPPLILYGEDGGYTPEVYRIYYPKGVREDEAEDGTPAAGQEVPGHGGAAAQEEEG